MPRFAANLTTMYNEYAFIERFAPAAKDGFEAVECLFPYEFARGVDLALEYAAVLGNRNVHVMAGLVAPSENRARHRDVYLRNLAYAAQAARSAGVTIVIEPINTRDMSGYFLNRQDDAQAICRELGAPNLKVQFDCYHCQIVEGDVATELARDIAGIGHIQIAGVPERHEPHLDELNYPYLFALVDKLSYDGWVGCEYRPHGATSAGLGWFAPYTSRNK
ncbi:TIM barrel protein [Trinickia sp. LjRoot230]|uniref:hydroxypyruvate isomerase family protein n=1 Tax=Trinickia sp. LjRoot230 TaxID=3342288 RepID=UPI003ED09DAC